MEKVEIRILSYELMLKRDGFNTLEEALHTITQLRDRVAALEELLRDAGTTSFRLGYSAGWHARRRALLTQNKVG